MKSYNPTFQELEQVARRSGHGSNWRVPPHEEIEKQAYQIYLNEGCPEGCELRHWLEAEAALARQ